MLVIFLHVFVIYLPAVGGEEGPGEPEQCITQQRQPTALNKTRSPFNQPGLALLSQSGHLSPPHFTLELLLAADVQEPLPCEDGQAQPSRDNAATASAFTLPTPCLLGKDPQRSGRSGARWWILYSPGTDLPRGSAKSSTDSSSPRAPRPYRCLEGFQDTKQFPA